MIAQRGLWLRDLGRLLLRRPLACTAARRQRPHRAIPVRFKNQLPPSSSLNVRLSGYTGVRTMPVLSDMRFAATVACVLGVGGCGTAAKVDAGQVRLDYQSSVADYRKCLAGFPNNPKACEAKRLIVETNERRIQQDDRQAVSDPTTSPD